MGLYRKRFHSCIHIPTFHRVLYHSNAYTSDEIINEIILLTELDAEPEIDLQLRFVAGTIIIKTKMLKKK